MEYIITFLLSLFCIYRANKQSSVEGKLGFYIWSAIALILPIILAGARDVYQVGTDSSNYYDAFMRAVQAKSFQDVLTYSDIEYGFKLFTYSISRITRDPFVFLCIFHGLFLIPFFIALFKLRDTINPTIGWFIYLFSFYNMSLNITRQCISMSLIILGITYLLNEKQSWKFWALFTIALLFHRTAILALIVYGIFKLTNRYRISDNKALYSMLFIIVALSVYSIFTYTNIITLLGDQREIYSSYLNGEEGSVSKSSFIFYATVALLLLLSRRGVENKILDFFFVVSLFSLFIIMATTVNQVFSRLGIYFTSMECISMAYILNNKNVQRGIVNSTVQGWKKYALILFVIGMWYFSVVYHNSNMTYPYVSSLIF